MDFPSLQFTTIVFFVLLLFTLQEKPEEANVERAEVPADLAASPGSALH